MGLLHLAALAAAVLSVPSGPCCDAVFAVQRKPVPATMHEGTALQSDMVPFVGKVFLVGPEGLERQFTCVLAGGDRHDCVTTAHSFLQDGEAYLPSFEDPATAESVALTVEFEACDRVYRGVEVDLGTTEIDAFTERHREKDVAIIRLNDQVCDLVEPAVMLPILNQDTAEKWLLPNAATRAPVTVVAYYMGCTLGAEPVDGPDTCEQYSSRGYIDSIAYLGGQPIYETHSIGTLPGSSGAPGLIIDTGEDAFSRHDDSYYWICLNVGHRPNGENACIALENGSFARDFIESRIQ